MLDIERLAEMVGNEGESGDLSDIQGHPLAKIDKQQKVTLPGKKSAATPAPEPEEVEEDEAPAPKKGAKEKKVNLTDFPEFRTYQAEMDKKLADAQRQVEKLRREAESLSGLRAQEQAERVKSALLSKPGWAQDGSDIQALLDQYVEAEMAKRQGAMSEWQRAKTNLLQQAGLPLDDERFTDDRYRDDPNTAWYRLQADVNEAKAANLAAQIQQLQTSIPEMVRVEMAKLAKRRGLLDVDVSEADGGEMGIEDWRRDQAMVIAGRMSQEAYLKKWENRLATGE